MVKRPKKSSKKMRNGIGQWGTFLGFTVYKLRIIRYLNGIPRKARIDVLERCTISL